jgi:predicted AAA+ superfamily ATPase
MSKQAKKHKFAFVKVQKMISEELIVVSEKKIAESSALFIRYMEAVVPWESQLIGIKGARGVGKTTLLLQHLRKHNLLYPKGLYLSLDDLFFTQNNLVDTAVYFRKNGGKVLVLDEVHKYPTWAKEIKVLYDRYTDLQIIFTGSSIIDMARQEGDLSRRALLFTMQGLSYREYLKIVHGLTLPVLRLDDILANRYKELFPEDFLPLQHFSAYLEKGYYPFTLKDSANYFQRLRQLSRQVVEYDMAELKGFDIRHARKMATLLYIIAQQVPFTPNLTKLAEKAGIHRNTITSYLYFLEDAQLINLLQSPGIGVGRLQKPEKVFLENPNLAYALADRRPEIGAIRETFFYNQIRAHHRVNFPEKGDFLVDDTWTVEVGGRNKNLRQLEGVSNAVVVSDDLEWGFAGHVPLWTFGMMY